MTVAFQTVGSESYGTDASAETAAPASVVSGDLLLLTLFIRCNPRVTPTTPTGWTVTGSQLDDSSTYGDVYVFHRIADGTATDTPTVTLSASPANGWQTRILRVDGHDATTPIDTTAGANRAGSSDTAEIPVATVARNGSLAICVAGKMAGGTNSDQTWPSGWTEIYDDWQTTAYRSFVACGYDQVDAGTMSSGQNTAGWDSSLSGTVAMLTVVVQPPSSSRRVFVIS